MIPWKAVGSVIGTVTFGVVTSVYSSYQERKRIDAMAEKIGKEIAKNMREEPIEVDFREVGA